MAPLEQLVRERLDEAKNDLAIWQEHPMCGDSLCEDCYRAAGKVRVAHITIAVLRDCLRGAGLES